MPAIEGEDRSGAVPVRKHDDRRVGDTDLLVPIAIDDVRGYGKIFRIERRELVCAVRELTQDAQLDVHPEASRREVVDLSDYVRRDDQGIVRRLDELGN